MVKNLHSMETLGSVTCICLDKTGILTDNKLNVVYMWYDMEFKRINKNKEDNIKFGEEQLITSRFHPKDKSFEKIKLTAIGSCFGDVYDDSFIPDNFPEFIDRKRKYIITNKDNLTKDELLKGIQQIEDELLPEYKIYYKHYFQKHKKEADFIDSGIMRFFNTIESIEETRLIYPALDVSFNSPKLTICVRKVTQPPNIQFIVTIKGSIEKVVEKCNKFIIKGKEYPISKKFKENVFKAHKCFQLNGKQVMALAYLELNPEDYNQEYNFNIWTEMVGNSEEIKANFPLKNFVFTSLLALEDLPK
jgi:magnesium-transporting ATPase (P-type)